MARKRSCRACGKAVFPELREGEMRLPPKCPYCGIEEPYRLGRRMAAYVVGGIVGFVIYFLLRWSGA